MSNIWTSAMEIVNPEIIYTQTISKTAARIISAAILRLICEKVFRVFSAKYPISTDFNS